MKQFFLTSILIFLTGFFAFSQSFSVTTTDGLNLANGDTMTIARTDPHANFNVIIWVSNNSLSTKIVKAKKTPLSLIPGSWNYFCWANCYDTSVVISPDSISMPSKYVEKGFSGDYESNGVSGSSFIRYTFFDIANPSDSIAVVFEYLTGSPVGINTNQTKIDISNAYPNPAKESFYINYNLENTQTANIEIANVIGSIVLKQEVYSTSTKVKIDVSSLQNGIYFYNFSVDGRTVVSKKLIIQR